MVGFFSTRITLFNVFMTTSASDSRMFHAFYQFCLGWETLHSLTRIVSYSVLLSRVSVGLRIGFVSKLSYFLVSDADYT